MQMRDFYKECWRRAWRGKLLLVEAVAGLLALVAVPVAAYWDPRGGVLNWVPLAVFGAVLVGTVVFGFLTAGYWIANEISTQRDTLRGQLDNRARRQTAVNRLWDLRREGVALRNQPIELPALASWTERFNSWHANVLREAGDVSINLRNWLDPLDITRPRPAGVNVVSEGHELNVRVASEILARLQSYLERELSREP